MRRASAALLALAVALAVPACGGGGGDDAAEQRVAQIEDAVREAGLPDEVAEVLGRAAGVLGETFRVTYDLGGDAGGTAVLTQDPPRRRVDLEARIDGAPVMRSRFSDGESATLCERTAGRWTCAADPNADAEAGAFGADQVDDVVEGLRTSRDAYDFRVADRDVAGVRARCLVTELKPGREPTAEFGAKGTLCVSAEGVPLLVETPNASLRALRYTTSVDDERFELPAEVSG